VLAPPRPAARPAPAVSPRHDGNGLGATAAPAASPFTDADRAGGGAPGLLWHLLPLGALTVALLTVGVHDLAFVEKRKPIETDVVGTDPAPAPVDPAPCLELYFHDRASPQSITEKEPWLGQATMRFGLVMVRDPVTRKAAAEDNVKRLTFRADGSTNNTC